MMELKDRLRGACDDYGQFNILLQRNAELEIQIYLLDKQITAIHARDQDMISGAVATTELKWRPRGSAEPHFVPGVDPFCDFSSKVVFHR